MLNLKSLESKKVLFSELHWDLDSFRPYMYEATIAAVDGTMVLMTNCVTAQGEQPVKDTWVNTASQLFVFIQPR